jgi:cytochrome c peroxidase
VAAALRRPTLLLLVACSVLPPACTDSTGPGEPGPERVTLDPEGLPPFPEFPGNPLTVPGIALGGRLFHDPILSADSTQSCASCHDRSHAFTDSGRRFSVGVHGREGTRNSPTLVNLAWSPSFFWEGRAATLEDQAREPVPDPIEMALPWREATARLAAHAEYPELFRRAFGTEAITQDRVVMAIAQFERTLVSNRSRWDLEQREEIEFTEAERRGERLFFSERAECFHCHAPPLFTDHRFHDNGLDLQPEAGRAEVTGLAGDAGKFRSPSLRNVAHTAPYMHDGRFATLEDVVEHYSSGIVRSPNLDPLLAIAPPPGLGFTEEEKGDLVAFLRALTDPDFLSGLERDD